MSARTRLEQCYSIAKDRLLSEQDPAGHWVGELSTSALSTATAVVALEMVRRNDEDRHSELRPVMDAGLVWLAAHQNDDGGWGDTVKSVSNISTTMLCHAAFHAAHRTITYSGTVDKAKQYIDTAGGVQALIERYGKDKTFSIPILTQCALAGLVDWKDVQQLPFEMACVPARFYKAVQLPVVSYALPALIAIGQVRHHFRKTWNPITWVLRWFAMAPSIEVLDRIQPPNGGFLEATPLTSFVTMSLAGMGLHYHPVVQRGLDFILASAREDGSWPIDTDLATWVTTLSVNALGDDLPRHLRPPIMEWLFSQQYHEVHPYTNADPGGWAWTNLPGGVPDADDTPGGILAILNLVKDCEDAPEAGETKSSIAHAVRWLLDLQNRDSGWPTFCRGWGKLPFDRSASDISAHVIRSLHAALKLDGRRALTEELATGAKDAMKRGFRYLASQQRRDGSWLPLWFGNQFALRDENPTYGTARVLLAYRDTNQTQSATAQRGFKWLRSVQNSDGGWGGDRGIGSSVEETAVAVEALIADDPGEKSVTNGLDWLMFHVENGTWDRPTPIGFYFAKLWYFESLYPQIFAVSALRQAIQAGCLT